MIRRIGSPIIRVKAASGACLPDAWLFTDPQLPDVMVALRACPIGRVGVVFRLPDLPADATRRLFSLCRRRRLPVSLAVAATSLPPITAGWHLRRGLGRPHRRPGFLTSSAHDATEIGRATRRGSRLIFLSPIFPTQSHPGAATLGPRRFVAITRGRRGRFAALGGMTPETLRLFGARCRAFGSISAFTRASLPIGKSGKRETASSVAMVGFELPMDQNSELSSDEAHL